jgi:CRISPR-associated protein Csc2
LIYVLNNILRTKRYGAQETRTGKVENHIVGIVFADGEMFSNLKFTQAIYDLMLNGKEKLETPLNTQEVLQNARMVVPELLKTDGIVFTLYQNAELDQTLAKINAIITDEAKLKAVLEQAAKETEQYYKTYIEKGKKK